MVLLVNTIAALLTLSLLLPPTPPIPDPARQQIYDALRSYHLDEPAREAFVIAALQVLQEEAAWNTDACLPGVVEFIVTDRHVRMVMNCTFVTSMTIRNLVEVSKPPQKKSQPPSSKP
jgi:hypothetical protein